MNHCIKCGQEIPDGELFCLECSLNPDTSLFNEPRAVRYHAPAGRMHTPQPVKRTAARQAPPPPPDMRRKEKPRRGLVAALVIVSLLLIAVSSLYLWQYSSMQTKEHRIRAKEADLALRQTEIDELYLQVEALTGELEAAEQLIADKEQEIQDLAGRLASSQSTQNQGAYDLSAKEQELARLEEENLHLLALSDELYLKIDRLEDEIAATEKASKEALAALAEESAAFEVKADYLDAYVVFVENGTSSYYHTYDCTNFVKTGAWAYNRRLAEAQGFAPCPRCCTP